MNRIVRGALALGLMLIDVRARADEGGPLAWVMPAGVEVVASQLEGERVDVYLDDHGHAGWTEAAVEALVRAALADAYEAGLGVSGVIPWVARDGRWVPVIALVPVAPPVPRKPWERSWQPGQGPVKKAIAPAVGRNRLGPLAGKVVYISAGHGFSYDPDLGRWVTQRGNTHDIVEDLVSAEAIDQLLTSYLENAGATVFTVRERDMSAAMVIADAEAGAAVVGEGSVSYSETGAWQDSASGGFRGDLAPYEEGENPFEEGTSRVALVAPNETAVARWTFDVPAPGDYMVYATWVAGDNRAPDAEYRVEHDGGVSRFVVDQRHHGATWMSLGRFWFDNGGAVALSNASGSEGSYVSADAVRIGGGMGDAWRGSGATIPQAPKSGRPRWEENARYYIQFTGAPQTVYRYASDERSDDVGARSRYAAWQNEVGEDAVYIAWHTNAPDPGTGTSTFVYGPNPPDGSYDFTGTPGSDDLGRLLHDEVTNDLQAAIDPGWRDRGLYSAYFGELNKNHNPEMPSALCEVAFHATAGDAAYLKEPRVRMVATRAFYQAVARYFAERDGQPTHLLPDPPERVSAVAIGPNTARIAWAAPPVDGVGGDAATNYRVYRSANGHAWDDGTDLVGTSLDVSVGQGAPEFFRVTAENAGGESFSSTVVAVGTACETGPRALIVHGFERIDAGLAPRDDLSAYGLGSVIRMRLAEMNRFDSVVAHAFALAHAGIAFDSAEASAVRAGLSLDAYGLVDWVLGEESTADETFSDAEQALVGAWLAPGKTLIASGAELGWDLGAKGSGSDQAFLARLGASYVGDDAGSYALTYDGGALVLDDGTRGAYDVQFPDVLAPAGAAEVLLRYGGGQTAGVVARANGTSIVLGVPIEALFPEAGRDLFVAGLVAGAGVARSVGCEVEPGPEEGAPEAVEPVEPAETVEAEADARAETEVLPSEDAVAGEGVHVLPTHREVVSRVRAGDGGCASSGAGSFVTTMMVGLFLLFVASLKVRWRRMHDDRAR